MSSLDLASDVAYEAAPPCFFDDDSEPVFPGFERIANRADMEVDTALVTDTDVSPFLQALVDELGGE